MLLEHREGEKPEGFLPHLLVQHFLQQLHAFLVVLRFKHEANVVQIDRRRLLLRLLRPHQPLEQLGGLVLAAHLRDHQRDLDAIFLVVHAGEAHKPIRPRDHALHVPQTLLGFDQPAQQGLAVRDVLESLQEHLPALADESLIEVAARPVQPRDVIHRMLLAELLVETQRLVELAALLELVRLLHLLPRRAGLPAGLGAVAAGSRVRIGGFGGWVAGIGRVIGGFGWAAVRI